MDSNANSAKTPPDDGVQSQTISVSFPRLPDVVWRCIVHHLSDSLPTLLLISAQSSYFQDVCRRHTSSFFSTIGTPVAHIASGRKAHYYYHTLLHLVLEGHLDPSSVFEFYCHDQWQNAPQFTPSPTARPGLQDGATEEQVRRSDRLFREAVRASRFIPAALESEICGRFQRGNKDAALAILLPLCTRLKLVEIPIDSPVCAAVFQSIGREYQAQGISAEEARRKAGDAALRDRTGMPWRQNAPEGAPGVLPFSELLVLFVSGHPDHGYTLPLLEMIPFMGIPSLHRMILVTLTEPSFPGWPADNVKCSCPQIYFQESSVTKAAVLAFAEGLNAPCEIRQWYQRPDPDLGIDREPEDPTWDRVLIKRKADGSTKVEARLEYDGGNPGYDHAWVSWLWHRRMQDWRRLDEEFRLQDGDRNVCWLKGMLAG